MEHILLFSSRNKFLKGNSMTRKIFCLLIITFFFATGTFAAEKTKLTHVKKKEGQETSRITLQFSGLPKYQIKTSGQRIDLFIHMSSVDNAFKGLSSDSTIIKTEWSEKDSETVLSFFFHRPPLQVESSLNESEDQLVLDILWDKKTSKMRPAITNNLPRSISKIPGTPILQRAVTSEYTGNWIAFIEKYETPVTIPVSLKHTLPPFPVIALFKPSVKDDINATIIENWGENDLSSVGQYSNNTNWDNISSTLQKAVEYSSVATEKVYLQLTYGEVLIRKGELSEALSLFTELFLTNPVLDVRRCATYLTSIALASSGDSYGAQYRLSIKQDSTTNDPLSPYYDILEAEIALTNSQYEKAQQILSRNSYTGGGMAGILKQMRQADTCFAIGRFDDATAIYKEISESSTVLKYHPYSFANLAELFHRQGEYGEAYTRYKKIAKQASKQHEKGLATYAAAVNWLKVGQKDQAIDIFKNIISDFPKSDASYRARMKLSDLAILLGEDAPELIIDYAKIASYAPSRELREEGALKQVIALHLQGEKVKSVELLNNFLRDYSNGTLHSQAEALQVEILPVAIKKLTDNNDYINALVLAEQNRNLLLSGRINGNFLTDLGLAFAGLWLWNRAARVYLYLLDVSKDNSDEEKIYLPLVEALYAKGDHRLVEEYTELYFNKFPEGPSSIDLFSLSIKGKIETGQLEEAAKILSSKDRPESTELDLIAGQIFWDLARYDEVERHLSKVVGNSFDEAKPEHIMLLAEALFRKGDNKKAQKLYEHLEKMDDYSDQATFRNAQIYFATDRSNDGLKLLQRLVDEAKSTLWQKMAVETLALKVP